MLRLAIDSSLRLTRQAQNQSVRTSKIKFLNSKTERISDSVLFRSFFVKNTGRISKVCLFGIRVPEWRGSRLMSAGRSFVKKQTNIDVVYYVVSGIVFMIGVSYASVPLYRMFCQATGIGGDPTIGHKIEDVSTMQPIRERPITVLFNADRHAAMQWNFKPSQPRVKVVPGETALAFYTAKNPTDTPIVGVATYNVVPFQAGPYFNKIQCFCFEEQWLNPHEEVDMPVFFYIDPEFDNDPLLANVDEIVLSYTFFKAEEGQILPVPGFINSRFKGASSESVS